MKFSRVIGKIDPKLISQAEDKLSKVFLELGVRYDNVHVGSGYGGDPLIFSLMYPVEHICTMSIATAATCGRRYYYNPKFVLKQSIKGLRIICAHEAWHAIYMHPQRRGSRNPKLWNIAVDYIVNGTVMEDFKARKRDPAMEFSKNLGRFMPLATFCEMVKDPFAKIPGFEDINPMADAPAGGDCKLPDPNMDRELTEQERKMLEKREKGVRFYYADPDLEDDMKRPEKIYDLLYKLLPKCPKCGRLGIYKMPKKGGNKQQEGSGQKGDQPQDGKDKGEGQHGDGKHDHGDGQPCDCGDQPGQCCDPNGGPCPECGGGMDIFNLGGLVDEHLDSEETEEKMAKRISDAMEAARKLAGRVPAALEDELGILTAPKVKWQDIIRCRLLKARAGNSRNDWTKFRTRPMFSGLLIPKRKSYHCNFGALLDTSGSMSTEDKAFGVSQLMGLDDRAEGILIFADATCYWDKAAKIKKCNAEELSKLKPVGGGGTVWSEFFSDYEKHIGKCDFLVIMTDAFLLDSDVANMRDPGIDVFWIVTSGADFHPPFGRSFSLRQ